MKNVKLLNVKGAFDYLPTTLSQRNCVISVLKENFERYGYYPLETTILCYFDVLSSKYAGGAEILKEVYKLSDQGQRKLGLRYDLTVPFCKAIAMNKNKINFPFRRYEIGKVFRDGPVKLGRSREFYQCDVDIVGVSGQCVEAEMISMAVEIYTALGINVEIQYGNRKLLSGLIEACGFPKELVSNIIMAIDKLEKIGQDGVFDCITEIINNALGCVADYSTQIRKLFYALKLTQAQLEAEYSNRTQVIDGLHEIIEFQRGLNILGISDYCKFVPSLARGLEVYTGNVWEVFDKDKHISSSLGGGGRYDEIISKFLDDGNMYPAVGMSFGLEPICTVLAAENSTPVPLIDLLVVPMGTQMECIKFANQLRKLGIRVLVDFTNKKLKKSLAYADKENIPFSCIIGSTELQNGQIVIKRMLSSQSLAKEKTFSITSINEIATYLKS